MARRSNLMGDSLFRFKNVTTSVNGGLWHPHFRTRELGERYGSFPDKAYSWQTPQNRFNWPYRHISAALFEKPLQELGLALDKFGRSLLPAEHKKSDGHLAHRRLMAVNGQLPEVSRGYAFIAPSSTIAGRVKIGRGTSVWYDVVIRQGLDEEVVVSIGEGVAIMDRAVIIAAKIGNGAIIEANATIHEGAIIGDSAYIGARAVVEAGAVVGDGAQIAPGVTVPAGTQVPANTLFSADGTQRTVSPDETAPIRRRREIINKMAADHHERSSAVTEQALEERYVVSQLAYLAEVSEPMADTTWQNRRRGFGVEKY